MLGAGLAVQIGSVGATIGTLSLLAGVAADLAGWDIQTTIFLTLGAAQLAVAMALRAPGHLGEKRPLDLAVAGAAALQVAGVYLPPLQSLLGTENLPLPAALVAVGLALVPGVAVWLRMRVERRA